ncbi:hypothetical protein DSL72_003866 [Monilinia vaccinii-corymbosi]|uniref:Uncharacterized protein n=1 Tax=Monilinia vaccinii-corymbosi TaxID=61207 RepID=A0A8A3NXW9_9HELO|nr:hypothetical protein DSL72_003866 [Monilinia vaccinii-corymbosi]
MQADANDVCPSPHSAAYQNPAKNVKGRVESTKKSNDLIEVEDKGLLMTLVKLVEVDVVDVAGIVVSLFPLHRVPFRHSEVDSLTIASRFFPPQSSSQRGTNGSNMT